jgi:hypothetical protein
VSDYWHEPIEGHLRNPPKNLGRSAYAVEVNPWARRGEIEAALLFRGSIVSAFGYIETRLSELAIRTSVMDEYIGLREKLPFTFGRRVKYLREIFEIPPLIKYQPYAGQFLDRLEQNYELRNLVAHARMQVLPDWGVTFVHYRHGDDNQILEVRKRILVSELEKAAWRLSRLSRLAQLLLERLERDGILPTMIEAS